MYDNMGEPGEDSRWDVFEKLHSYIDSTFEFVWVPLSAELVLTITGLTTHVQKREFEQNED